MEGDNFYFAISYKFLKCVKWDFLSDPPKTSFLVYYKFHEGQVLVLGIKASKKKGYDHFWHKAIITLNE